MKQVKISKELIEKAMRSQPVAQALHTKAEAIRARAESIAAAEDVDGEFTVQDGVRPRGRPFSSVHCDNVDQEYGTSKTERSRILGRAARG